MKILLFTILGLMLAAMAPTSPNEITEEVQVVTISLTSDLPSDIVDEDLGCRMTCCISLPGGAICSTRGGIFSSCERALEKACGDIGVELESY